MQPKKVIETVLLTLSATLIALPTLAKPTDAELLDAVAKAKVLSGEYRINLVTEDSQATISAFLDNASKTGQADDDCKINAVLIAKKLMDLNADLVRVKVLFYGIDGDRYRQVVVKAGDVLALGGGQIDKEKLLSSLEVTKGSRSSNRGSSATSDSTPNKATSTTTPATSTPATSTPATSAPATSAPATTTPSAPSVAASGSTTSSTAKAPLAIPTFSGAGISFSYPKDWIPKRGANASVLAHFFSSTLGEHNYIDVDFFNQNRSVEGFADEKYRDWIYQPNYQVVYSGAMKLGPKGTIHGISRLVTYQIENYPEFRYYQRHVFFGQPGRIYCMRFHAQQKDLQKVNAAFEHMLVTLQAQGLTPIAPTPKNQGAKKHK